MPTGIKEYRWSLAGPPDAAVVARLSKEINVPEPIARILVDRGISTYDDAMLYFRPTLEHLHDPFLLDGMDAAVQRILRALESRERKGVILELISPASWPPGFFESIRIDDPAFCRPDQGQVPPAPVLS